MSKLTLLSESNPKTSKGVEFGYRTAALMLAPADLARAGKSVCPWSTPGCRAACLYTAGRGAMSNTKLARIRRTEYFLDSPREFRLQLRTEITKFVNSCILSGHSPAVRLNCLSDLSVENWRAGTATIMELFPDVQFYDYTKSRSRMGAFLRGDLPDNYHLTFSRSEETPDVWVEGILSQGGQVAIVGEHRAIASRFPHFKVFEGDSHDLTFLRHRGVILSLTPKGKAKQDRTGFVLWNRDLPGGGL